MQIKSLIFFFLSIILCECGPKTTQTERCVSSSRQTEEQIKPYKNPALIYGSSFPTWFQGLFRNNQYNLMLQFTSSRSIRQYGKERIRNYYRTGFNFSYSLGTLSNITYQGDTILCTFSKAYVYGTRRKVTVLCCIENDSTKIILANLADTFPD
jgi:hypothetical protein